MAHDNIDDEDGENEAQMDTQDVEEHQQMDSQGVVDSGLGERSSGK